MSDAAIGFVLFVAISALVGYGAVVVRNRWTR